MLMREMQSRAVMESTAVFLRVLITCYIGLALAQGKVLGTKPQGVFAPAIRPSLSSQHEPRHTRNFTSTAFPSIHSAKSVGAGCWREVLVFSEVCLCLS